MASVPNKIVLKSTTKISLNDRFSSIPKPRPAPQAAAAAAPQARLRMQQEQQASIKNRRLAQQMANRPAVQAALKLKKRSLQQRLGVQARLGVRGGRGGIRGAPRGRGQFQRGTAVTYRGRGRGLPVRGRGRGTMVYSRSPRGSGVRGRGYQNRGRGQYQTYTYRGRGQYQPYRIGWRPYNFFVRGAPRGGVGGYFRGGRGQQVRGRGVARGARGGFRGGRGRGRGAAPTYTKDSLDTELDSYMSKTKASLDQELDAYMASGDDNQ